MEINEVNKEVKDKEEDKNEDIQKEKEDSLSNKDSAAEDGDANKERLSYPSKLTKDQKLALLRTFGRKDEKDEGKILKDENEEDLQIDDQTFWTLLSYYGHWSKFVFLTSVVFLIKWFEISYGLVITN